jgi:two-component system, sensor histidine kinase
VSSEKFHIDPKKNPWIAALISLVIIHAGTQVSLFFKYDQGVADYYLPTALSLILINWWGPRIVIPVMYLNATFGTFLWGIPFDRWYQWFLYGLPETIFTFLSWYLFRSVFKGKFWLPDTKNVVLFLIIGILIPSVPEIFSLQWLLVLFGDQPMETFWPYAVRNFLGEFTSSFGLTLPVLYYLSPVMNKYGLLYESSNEISTPDHITRNGVLELALLFLVLFTLLFVIEFEKFWYLYGIVSLYVAIRFGFGPAVITNYYIFLITYVLPKFLIVMGMPEVTDHAKVINIFIGACLLFVFAAITGRVITDVKIAEAKIQKQYHELDQTNKELDRFVYSVSHDLSAPLKSILGLVNISRITPEPEEHTNYLNRIESSVVKLENFISEILDYSRNKRQQVVAEQVKLKELCDDILDNLRFMMDFNKISVDLQLQHQEIVQDKARLKIILNNLLSNAVKFQKRFEGHQPYIKITSRKAGDDIQIEIEDNGEGIKPELQNKIFDMFYRGNENSRGSGLGLYIAREAASKIHGNISVKSEYGKGSVFILSLKNLNLN